MKRMLIFLFVCVMAVIAEVKPVIQVEALSIATIEEDMSAPAVLLGDNYLGIEANNEITSVKATVNFFSDLDGSFVINIHDAYFNVDLAPELGISVGHMEVPFGFYESNCVNYPLIRGVVRDYDIQAGLDGNIGSSLTYNLAGYSSDSLSLNSLAARVRYGTDMFTGDLSVRTGFDTTDVAFGLKVAPAEVFDFRLAGYKTIEDYDGGAFVETSFYPNDGILPSVRMGFMTEDGTDLSQLSVSNLIFLNKNVTFGMEYSILWDIANNSFTNPGHGITVLFNYIW